jgi:hypothetical protein
LEDKYKLYDNLVNCKDVCGGGGAGSSSDPIYSELNVAVSTQDCEKLDESKTLFNDESVPVSISNRRIYFPTRIF